MTDTDHLMAGLPGCDLVRDGLADVRAGRDTIAAKLVMIGSPRLRDCGIAVHVSAKDALLADRNLYDQLALTHGKAAHSKYNALIRQLVSFERALEGRISRRR